VVTFVNNALARLHLIENERIAFIETEAGEFGMKGRFDHLLFVLQIDARPLWEANARDEIHRSKPTGAFLARPVHGIGAVS
jgi:hypothetical protein